jgi:hypothetical protein
VAEKNLSVRGVDADTFVAPDVRSLVTDASDSIATDWAPKVNRVVLDVLSRNGAQTKAQSAYLHSRVGKEIVKTAPSQRRRPQQEERNYTHCDSRRRIRNPGKDRQLGDNWNKK